MKTEIHLGFYNWNEKKNPIIFLVTISLTINTSEKDSWYNYEEHSWRVCWALAVTDIITFKAKIGLISQLRNPPPPPSVYDGEDLLPSGRMNTHKLDTLSCCVWKLFIFLLLTALSISQSLWILLHSFCVCYLIIVRTWLDWLWICCLSYLCYLWILFFFKRS